MTCISRALMVGGGIAGLSAAIALSRIGVECDVVELAEAPLGASISISGRAADALYELGIYDAVHETGRPFEADTKAMYMWKASGELISRGPARPNWPGAKTAVGVFRPELLRHLTEEAQRLGVTIHRGVTVQSMDDTGDTCRVVMTNGVESQYDLVVGADGISSKTRTRIFPECQTPTYSGQMSIRWMCPGPAIDDEGWYNGPVGRLGFYYLPHQDVIYIPAVINAPVPLRLTKPELYALYVNLLDSYSAPAVVEMRRRLTPDADLVCRPFDWILVSQRWHRGRTLLIGDAAHATTAHMGMGGGMAIEDAVVLAQCVKAAVTLDEALRAFMTRRFERVRTVVETSVALSNLEQAHAPPSENVTLLTAAFAAISQPY